MWYGFLAPAGTPVAIVHRLHAETQKLMASPQMKERYAALALEPVERTAQQFGEHVKSELANWRTISQVSGAHIQ